MSAVFVTPAAMAEHGAALGAAAAGVRSGVRRGWRRLAATAIAAVATSRRRRVVDHAEMVRLRLVADALQAMRAGAYADAALGGPTPR